MGVRSASEQFVMSILESNFGVRCPVSGSDECVTVVLAANDPCNAGTVVR